MERRRRSNLEAKLRKEAEKYFAIAVVRCATGGSDSFVNKCLGQPQPGGHYKTLITSDSTGNIMDIAAYDVVGHVGHGLAPKVISVDLSPDNPVAIVAPGFYDEEGNETDVDHGTWSNKRLRKLKKKEISLLVADLKE